MSGESATPRSVAAGPAAPGTVGPPPGQAGLAIGRVVHHRHRPAAHRFAYDITQIWIDPDRPGDLFDRHRLWSHRRPAPVRFRRRDHLDGGDGLLGPAVRRALAPALGREPTGPLRMLTQPRVWGWLFNPLTVHLAWDDPDPDGDPVAALLEVTNTPWKERHRYPVALTRHGDRLVSRFAKHLHVSPFLDGHHVYELCLQGRDDGRMIDMTLNVHPLSSTGDGLPVPPAPLDDPVLETRLTTRVVGADHRAMTAVLRPARLPTHRVSFGIHRQALALWRKRIPFVPHPDRRS